MLGVSYQSSVKSFEADAASEKAALAFADEKLLALFALVTRVDPLLRSDSAAFKPAIAAIPKLTRGAEAPHHSSAEEPAYSFAIA